VIYPKYLPIDCSTNTVTPGDGTPFAVYVVIEGFLSNKTYAVKSRAGPNSSDMTYAISWKDDSKNQWANDNTDYTNLLKIKTDSSGNWSGWLVAKVKKNITQGILLYRVRLKPEPYDGNYIDSFSVGTNSLNMLTQGGWIEGHAYVNNIPVINGVIVVKDSNGNIIGTYLTEDNSVTEGYNSSDTGYFKVGVPEGSNYTIELRDPSTNLPYTGAVTGVSVTAGLLTSVDVNINTNSVPTLDWAGETGYETNGVEPSTGNTSTPFTYKVKYIDMDNDAPLSGFPKIHILKENSSEITGSPFTILEFDSSDSTYTDGKLYAYSTMLPSGTYSYFFEARDSKNALAIGPPTLTQTGPIVSLPTFILDVNTVGNGILTKSPDKVSYNSGESITLIATPANGYSFVKWTIGGTDYTDNPLTITMNSDKAVTAIFAITNYIITFDSQDGTPVPSQSVNYGEKAMKPADPTKTGYTFGGWSKETGCVNVWNFATDTVTSDITLYAKWTINQYIITTSAGPGGTITPSGTITATCGSSKTFTIKADHKFMIFKVFIDGNPIQITNPFEMSYMFTSITSNHTINAEFILIPDTIPPTLTLPTINGVNLDTPNGMLQINQNTLTFTVSATDESGISRMVVKVNGVVQIDKNNLDPTIYLNEGVNTVEVTVYDTAGNYVTKSFKVISDTKPPVIDVNILNTVSSPQFVLKGTAIDLVTGVQSLTVNGNSLVPTLEGNFETKLTLSTGANTIIIEATDRAGNKSSKSYTISYVQPQARPSYMIILKIDDPNITVNGTSQKIDVQGSKPIIKDGRTLLPIRTLIESLGGEVLWYAKEQKVTITLNGHSIILWIGKTTALVDGSKTTLDVAPQIINGRTYIPLRFVSEHLGGSVNWDITTQTVTIYYWP
jgi:uncharacterized repeat protein (TIGR02543 family)